jgi:Ca2+-binding RTX toxin-like protein
MDYVRLGGEFLVNTVTLAEQASPKITFLTSGGFVVIWSDGSDYVADGTGYNIKAQIYSASGARVGTELMINTTTPGSQLQPTITALASGGFVASWSDSSGQGGDTSASGIKAQVFDASGGKVGTEFLVNTVTATSQNEPTITSLASGGFVVSWTDWSGQGGDAYGTGIKAQVFNASGAKVGTEIPVNTLTGYHQLYPTITSLPSGGFVISWTDLSGQSSDASDGSIKAQIFNASGSKVGTEILVNTTTRNSQELSTITSLASGGFVISWIDFSGQGSDVSGNGIKAQIFNALGAKVGTEFLVNTVTQDYQYQPTITSLASGGFVVSWIDGSGQGGDASSYGIKAQIFNAEGAKVGTEFLVNTGTLGMQDQPTITSLISGGFVVSWVDSSGEGGDASGTGIKAQIFTPDTIEGTAGDDNIVGTIVSETFYGRAGNDTLRGESGDDTLDGGLGTDTMIGGAGNDTYVVDSMGDVVTEAAGEGTDTVKTSVGSKTDYTQIYKLPAEVENLFGTAAVAQGVSGNALSNVITMGDTGDLILLHDGGDDTVSGGGGNDFIYYGGALTNGDRNDGGEGIDTLGLVGTYTITFDADDLVGIEKLAAFSGGTAADAIANSYNFTMIDANVAPGAQLTVIAQSLLAHETLTFDGSAETDGKFYIKGGRGNDTITGGQGADTIFGNLGADVLKGGGGNDVFQYVNAAESAGTSRDSILDFSAGDKINLGGIDADGDAADGNGKFSYIGSDAFGRIAGQLRVTGSGSDWLVEADVDGDGTADLVIRVTTADGHALSSSDFFL